MVACEKENVGGDPSKFPAVAGEITVSGPLYDGYSITLSIDEIAEAITYKWYKDGLQYQNTASRELTVSEQGIYRVAGVNKQGEGVSSPEQEIVFSTEKLLIDRMVGTWNAKEYIAFPNNNSVRFNNHTVTIRKVDDKTVEISNFTWRNYPDPTGAGEIGDTLKAQIDNENSTMYILPPAQFLPTWVEDYATLLLPAFSEVTSENVGRQFPLQTVTEDGNGGLRIVFYTGDHTKNINANGTTITVPITYYVATTQRGFFTGTLAYYMDTVWTKQ